LQKGLEAGGGKRRRTKYLSPELQRVLGQRLDVADGRNGLRGRAEAVLEGEIVVAARGSLPGAAEDPAAAAPALRHQLRPAHGHLCTATWLPDFSWCNIPTQEKIFLITIKYTKLR
jgi:hypothetical protein